MKKLLSVIIPAYNMERYLRDCLESLCVSDITLLEVLDVIVVNDGSNDGTSAIAHEFVERHPSVFCVIDKPNGHYGSCVNRGLMEAKGEFVKILDADDSFDTVEFEKYLHELRHLRDLSPAVDLVLSHVRYVDAKGRQTEKLEYPFNGRSDLTLDDVANLKTGRFIHGYTYRLSVFDGLDYHQTEGMAYTDTEWIFLPMTRVKRVAHCPLFVYRYLVGREGQSCNTIVLSKQLPQIRKAFDTRLDQYRRLKSSWSPAAVRYAETELASSAGYLYITYLQNGWWKFRKELHSLDRAVATDLLPVKHTIGSTDILFPNSRFRICYGKLAAQHPSSRILLSLALRIKKATLH